MIVSRAAIRRPVTVAMVFIRLVIIGGFAGLRMAVEQYPDRERPYIGVGIPYGSTSTQEIERNVTRPVEEILSTIGGIERMYSRTRTGFVWISITLDEGEDVAAKGVEAKELVESVRHRLPADIRHIRLGGRDEENAPILSFVISAPDLDPEDAWRLLDARVRVPLERIAGVNSVHLFGAEQQYVRIALDPGRLEAHGLDVLDVQRRLAEENFYLSAGSIDLARLETQVRPLGRFEGLEDILDLPVRPGLTVADIADVEYVPQDEADQRRLNGEDALGVSVYKKPEANLVAVAADVQKAMNQALEDPELAEASFLTVSNQAESVLRSLENLIQNGVIGGILSAIVLFAFIRRVVPALFDLGDGTLGADRHPRGDALRGPNLERAFAGRPDAGRRPPGGQLRGRRRRPRCAPDPRRHFPKRPAFTNPGRGRPCTHDGRHVVDPRHPEQITVSQQ